MIAATSYGTGQLTLMQPASQRWALITMDVKNPSIVPKLRKLVRRVAISWDLPDEAVDALTLITSELVTNVVTHSGSPDVQLLLTATQEHAELHARDHGHWHAPHQRGALPTGGRGLDLVRAYADLRLTPGQSGTVATARLTLAALGTQNP